MSTRHEGKSRGGFRGPTRPAPPIFTCKFFLDYKSPIIFALMPMLQFICRSKMSILCVCVCVCLTVKIHFDNTSACKYSVILAFRSVPKFVHAFAPPPIQKF